jgi:TonB family protein
MNRTATIHDSLTTGPNRREELLGWIAGLGFTLFLFLALAHIENVGPAKPAAEIAELRAVSFPLEAPPPPPHTPEPAAPPENMPAFAGLDVGASDSPVRIAVMPPDLEALLPSTREPPRALIQPGYLHSELKPRLNTPFEERRVYQVSEVDQLPEALVRVAPAVPENLFGDTRTLRVMLLVVIDTDGSVASVRLGQSSGQPVFDDAAMEKVRTVWEFTPAIRRGKKVKCLAQQALRVNLGGGSPFSLP